MGTGARQGKLLPLKCVSEDPAAGVWSIVAEPRPLKPLDIVDKKPPSRMCVLRDKWTVLVFGVKLIHGIVVCFVCIACVLCLFAGAVQRCTPTTLSLY